MVRMLLTATLAVLFLSGCQTNGNRTSIKEYCEERPAICILLAAAVVGGVIAIASNNDSDAGVNMGSSSGGGGGGGGGGNVGNASDIRLKKNVRFLETLENGVNLYAFQYKGSTDFFVGVIAQELLEHKRFSRAVSTTRGGYYLVDYNKLGLVVVGMKAMNAASRKVLADHGS